MLRLKENNKGFGASGGIVAALVVIVIVTVGWGLHSHNKNSAQNSSTKSQTADTKTPISKKSDIYTGWKTATSTRAKFSIKYPTDWTYSETVGSKDSIEHITITSPKFQLAINSYLGKDTANGGTSQTTCPDCQNTSNSQAFTAGKVGSLRLSTITYTLDSGVGNALVLIQPDSTYYISSPAATDVTTTFRGISTLGSLQEYQNETLSQFTANSDYAIAQNILKSVSY